MNNGHFYAVTDQGELIALGKFDDDFIKAHTEADNHERHGEFLAVLTAADVSSALATIDLYPTPQAQFSWNLNAQHFGYYGEYPTPQAASIAQRDGQKQGNDAHIILDPELVRGWKSVYVRSAAESH